MAGFTVIDVFVNVLPRARITKEEIRKAIESANKTLKKAGAKIRLEWNAAKHLRSPARVGGTNDDSNADPNERQKHLGRGHKELKRRFGGRGFKLWLCDHILVRKNGALVPKGEGLAYHRSPNAFISLEKHKSGAGANRALDTGEMGRTIAHELCHVLTVKAHRDKSDNLMNESGSGSKLDPDQLGEIGKGALERARKTKVKEAPGSTPAKKTTRLGCWVDENEPPSQRLLATARLFQPGPRQAWTGLIQLVDVIDHAKPIDLSLVMRLPAAASGEPEPSARTSARVEVSIRGEGKGAPIPAGTLTDPRTGRTEPLATIALVRQDMILDDFAEAAPELTPAFDEIQFEVEADMIGDPGAGTTVELELAETVSGMRFDAYLAIESDGGKVDTGPAVDLDRYLVGPGADTVARGQQFTPGCTARLYLDDDPIGSAEVGDDGGCRFEFAAPAEPGFYWVRVVDACGESDFTILDVG